MRLQPRDRRRFQNWRCLTSSTGMAAAGSPEPHLAAVQTRPAQALPAGAALPAAQPWKPGTEGAARPGHAEQTPWSCSAAPAARTGATERPAPGWGRPAHAGTPICSGSRHSRSRQPDRLLGLTARAPWQASLSSNRDWVKGGAEHAAVRCSTAPPSWDIGHRATADRPAGDIWGAQRS